MIFEVTFAVEAESEEQFRAELNEDAIAAALPGPAWLLWVEEKKTITEAMKAKWRRLRRS